MRASIQHLLCLLAPLAMMTGGSGSGCTRARPAADTALTRQPDEPLYARSVSEADARALEATFASLAAGRTAVSRPIAAPASAGGGRWSDVYSAALYACDDIEAAVVSKTLHDWGWEIHLRTVEDWPGTMIIRRIDDQALPAAGRVYQASAAIGRFEDDHADRARALLEAFDKHLQAFGRKRRLPD